MSVPNWPCQAQSIERQVKQVTDACDRVFSHEKRDGWIKNQEIFRQLISKNDSKQDLVKLFSFQIDLNRLYLIVLKNNIVLYLRLHFG